MLSIYGCTKYLEKYDPKAARLQVPEKLCFRNYMLYLYDHESDLRKRNQSDFWILRKAAFWLDAIKKWGILIVGAF